MGVTTPHKEGEGGGGERDDGDGRECLEVAQKLELFFYERRGAFWELLVLLYLEVPQELCQTWVQSRSGRNFIRCILQCRSPYPWMPSAYGLLLPGETTDWHVHCSCGSVL